MDNHTATEIAYKNGQKDGYTAGALDTVKMMISLLETRIVRTTSCKCGHRKMSDFYNYCPYCGEKY